MSPNGCSASDDVAYLPRADHSPRSEISPVMTTQPTSMIQRDGRPRLRQSSSTVMATLNVSAV